MSSPLCPQRIPSLMALLLLLEAGLCWRFWSKDWMSRWLGAHNNMQGDMKCVRCAEAVLEVLVQGLDVQVGAPSASSLLPCQAWML